MIQDERHMHSELGSQAAERLLGAVTMHQISIAPLTGAALGPYGEVVEMDGSDLISINQGFAARFDTLAKVDVATAGASVNISLFVAKARPLPIDVKLMERHPLGTQLFFPLQDKSWLVLVCADPRVPASFRAFRASGRQGVNYARNTWHHPLLVLTDEERFLVVDRKGAGDNLEEVWLDDQHRLCLSPYV